MPDKEQNINKTMKRKLAYSPKISVVFFIDYSISINLRKRNVLIWKHQQHWIKIFLKMIKLQLKKSPPMKKSPPI